MRVITCHTAAARMDAELAELQSLAEQRLGRPLGEAKPLLGGGSERRYYRFAGGEEGGYVGVLGGDPAENRAFIGFTLHFASQGLPVPRIFAADKERRMYLMEDLGDVSLAHQLAQMRASPVGKVLALATLTRVIAWLPRIQIHGGQGLDYSLCPQGESLNGEVFDADVEQFLGQYVARHAAHAEPSQEVLGELARFVALLDTVPRNHFCYRDFQPRNIMWRDGPVFIDYQGGRRGALQYDLAAFLYSPDTGLGERERSQLIEVYLKALRDCGEQVDPVRFLADFHPFVLVRRMQALGAYGYLASQGQEEYLQRIPQTLADLRQLLTGGKLALGMPALEGWLRKLCSPSARGLG